MKQASDVHKKVYSLFSLHLKNKKCDAFIILGGENYKYPGSKGVEL